MSQGNMARVIIIMKMKRLLYLSKTFLIYRFKISVKKIRKQILMRTLDNISQQIHCKKKKLANLVKIQNWQTLQIILS